MTVTDPELHHIVLTWDLDEGTGLGVRYGDMPAERAAMLLELAARLVREHAHLLYECEAEDDDEDAFDDVEYLDDDEADDGEDE